jgi:hypothetical protein
MFVKTTITINTHLSDEDQDELDSDEDEYYGNHNVDTSRVDEIPAKEPKFNAVSFDSKMPNSKKF